MNKASLFSTSFLLLLTFTAKGQLLQEGKYIGYEKMDVQELKGGQLRYWPGMNMPTVPQSIPNELWFHQVTITIHKDSAFIRKVPVVVRGGQMTYSDSAGGFYAYKGEVGKYKNKSVFIRGSLSESRNTGYSGTGTPFYIAVSYFNAEVEGDKLVLQTGNLGKLVFRRVE